MDATTLAREFKSDIANYVAQCVAAEMNQRTIVIDEQIQELRDEVEALRSKIKPYTEKRGALKLWKGR